MVGLTERDEIVARLNCVVFGSLGPIFAILADSYTRDGIIFVMNSGEEHLAFLSYERGEEIIISFALSEQVIVIPKTTLMGKPN